MTSYRGVEAIGCVGMQLIVEPDLGLCDNLKPNRFFGIERKRLIRILRQQGPLFYLKGILHMDLLTQSKRNCSVLCFSVGMIGFVIGWLLRDIAR